MSGYRTRWGWHRLDARWAQRLVDDAGISKGDLVLDVGAGSGAITRPLVERGARVIAFELHPARAQGLRREFVGSNVTVVCADGADVRLPRRPFRVVANPPFGISVALLRRLTAPGSQLIRADLVLPWHTADRWIGGSAPGAARWLKEFECVAGRPIPRSALTPPPPNGVATLIVRRRGWR
ncbi:MAG TPA: rRNA adenine N-6-methyltransferase family protein [Acidimicrobiales bacterium]|nr:rRNA adenine N-6-methyltransferase family protein [Acidimicrobiales bacterium]